MSTQDRNNRFRGTTLGQGMATAIDNVVSDLSIVFADCNFNKVNCGRVSKGFLVRVFGLSLFSNPV